MASHTARPNESATTDKSEIHSMNSNPSISLSPPTHTHQATLSPPGRSTRPNSQIISPTALSTNRLAGNKSPNSIPSSPTSVHSSSSAIFERDIEQAAMTHPHTVRDPHHISRAMTHELDAAVPSVLSAAISALNVGSEDDVSVIAPAHMPRSRFNHSRSPSPTATLPRPPFTERQSTGPYLPGAFPPSNTSNAPSPPASDLSPALSPNVTGTSPGNGAVSPSSPASPTTPPMPAARPRPRKSNPQLNTEAAQNRLSFMSYHDLLASTPVATVPLSALVSGNEPGHLPGVIGLHGHAHGSGIDGLGKAEGEGGDVGGEFDREGLGKGLEERLEEVLNAEGRA